MYEMAQSTREQRLYVEAGDRTAEDPMFVGAVFGPDREKSLARVAFAVCFPGGVARFGHINDVSHNYFNFQPCDVVTKRHCGELLKRLSIDGIRVLPLAEVRVRCIPIRPARPLGSSGLHTLSVRPTHNHAILLQTDATR